MPNLPHLSAGIPLRTAMTASSTEVAARAEPRLTRGTTAPPSTVSPLSRETAAPCLAPAPPVPPVPVLPSWREDESKAAEPVRRKRGGALGRAEATGVPPVPSPVAATRVGLAGVGVAGAGAGAGKVAASGVWRMEERERSGGTGRARAAGSPGLTLEVAWEACGRVVPARKLMGPGPPEAVRGERLSSSGMVGGTADRLAPNSQLMRIRLWSILESAGLSWDRRVKNVFSGGGVVKLFTEHFGSLVGTCGDSFNTFGEESYPWLH